MNEQQNASTKWPYSQLGQALLQAESTCLQNLWKNITGDYLLILGDPIQETLANHTRIKHRVLISQNNQNLSHNKLICAKYESLPILPHSVHAILLPHILEYAENPCQILRETKMALHPEGHLILIGFNPLSLFGLRRLFSFNSTPQWSGHFHSTCRIKSWLKLLNFEIVESKKIFYRPPISSKHLLKKLSFIEKFGACCAPFFGGVYVIVARKKAFGATPLKIKWKTLPKVVANSFPKPATREAHHDAN